MLSAVYLNLNLFSWIRGWSLEFLFQQMCCQAASRCTLNIRNIITVIKIAKSSSSLTRLISGSQSVMGNGPRLSRHELLLSFVIKIMAKPAPHPWSPSSLLHHHRRALLETRLLHSDPDPFECCYESFRKIFPLHIFQWLTLLNILYFYFCQSTHCSTSLIHDTFAHVVWKYCAALNSERH